MNKEMVIFDGVTFKYSNAEYEDSKLVINNIDLKVKHGEFVAILGHNGSGKSTIAKHINGLLVPSSGKVYVENIDTSDENQLWNVRSKAGMVFQNPDNQIVATIVEEDVAFGPENLGLEPSEIRRRVDKSLDIVGMSEYKMHSPALLSGGQKQRIAIAGVLAMQPNCIVLDEPTSMLDPQGRKDVIETIKKLNKQQNITIILITHYMDEAAQADRVIVVDGGEIKVEGTPRDVFPQVQLMKEIGLDVPQVTELAYELIKEGIKLDDRILSIDEMVDAICQLK